MRDNNNAWRPESQDTLNAVEDVIDSGRRKKKKNFFEANMLPLKGDSGRERARKIIFDMLVLVMVGSIAVLTWWVGIDPWMHSQNERMIADMRPTWEYEYEEPGNSPDNPPENGGEDGTTPTAPRQVRRLSFDELFAINHEVVAWLYAPGANIDLPIVQTANNNFYLYRDLQGRPSRYGNPFMDWRNRIGGDEMSTNLIIYGHHMRNGTIFSRLTNFRNPEHVRRNPLVTLMLPSGDIWEYKIFAVLNINGRPEHDNGFAFAVNTPEFPNEANFDGFIRQLAQRTEVQTGVDVRWGDYLLTLQTCIYEFPDQFLYVVARRVRPGENNTVDRNQIRRNPNPRHPQELFNRRGQTNPFRDAERWFPG